METIALADVSFSFSNDGMLMKNGNCTTKRRRKKEKEKRHCSSLPRFPFFLPSIPLQANAQCASAAGPGLSSWNMAAARTICQTILYSTQDDVSEGHAFLHNFLHIIALKKFWLIFTQSIFHCLLSKNLINCVLQTLRPWNLLNWEIGNAALPKNHYYTYLYR